MFEQGSHAFAMFSAHTLCEWARLHAHINVMTFTRFSQIARKTTKKPNHFRQSLMCHYALLWSNQSERRIIMLLLLIDAIFRCVLAVDWL